MDLKTIVRIFNIFGFVLNKPNCTAPEIRTFLGIKHEPNLSKEEKRFYALLTKLDKEGYIFKQMVKKKGSGGAQFRVQLSEKGFSFLSEIKSNKFFFSTFNKDSFDLLLEREKEFGLELILRIFSSELVDILENLVATIMKEVLGIDFFKDINYAKQVQIIKFINEIIAKPEDEIDDAPKKLDQDKEGEKKGKKILEEIIKIINLFVSSKERERSIEKIISEFRKDIIKLAPDDDSVGLLEGLMENPLKKIQAIVKPDKKHPF